MYKRTINNISLQLVMQTPQVTNQPTGSHAGVLSRNDEGFRFEEAVKIKRPRRNPKLYEGQYVSLVHRSDDKYACTLKHIHPGGEDYNHHDVAFKIYLELIDALQIIR